MKLIELLKLILQNPQFMQLILTLLGLLTPQQRSEMLAAIANMEETEPKEPA